MATMSHAELEQRLHALQPADTRTLEQLLTVTWETVDPARLELCRIRLAVLMGDQEAAAHRHPRALAAGLDEDKVEALDRWYRSDAFDELDRALLRFTEQFNMSVSSMGTDEVEALRAHLSDADLAAFVGAIYAIELDMRLRMVAARVLTLEESA